MENNTKEKITLEEVLDSINARLGHLEDIEADTRLLMVKMVKQNNTIVDFLRGTEMEISEEVLRQEHLPKLDKEYGSGKIRAVRELLDEFMERKTELKEFEEELQKHKDKITPGEVGEA